MKTTDIADVTPRQFGFLNEAFPKFGNSTLNKTFWQAFANSANYPINYRLELNENKQTNPLTPNNLN